VATRDLSPFVVPARAGTYCRGCEIVEYNPALDEDRRTAGVVGDVLAALFGPGVPPGAISRQ
jgi:arginase family enzyme